jgi:hypothetical protein
MPNSVFYEKAGEHESSAQACKGEPFECRATSYELKGNYSSLAGAFGIVESQTYTPEAHWQVLVDGRMEKSGKAQSGTSVPLDVPLHHGNTLELRATLEGTYNSGTTSIVWGDAKVEP